MANNPLEKLEEQLTCSICLDQYKDPKILPCHHSFCRECLEEIPQTLEKGRCFIPCPSCREPAEVPEGGGVSALPPSFIINNLLEIYQGPQDKNAHDGKESGIDQEVQKMRAAVETLQLENKQLYSKMRVIEQQQETEKELKKDSPIDSPPPRNYPEYHHPLPLPEEEPVWFPPHHPPRRGHHMRPPHRHHPHHRPPPPPGHHPHHRPPPPPGHYPHHRPPPPPGHHPHHRPPPPPGHYPHHRPPSPPDHHRDHHYHHPHHRHHHPSHRGFRFH